jgi:hypothetical protein
MKKTSRSVKKKNKKPFSQSVLPLGFAPEIDRLLRESEEVCEKNLQTLLELSKAEFEKLQSRFPVRVEK